MQYITFMSAAGQAPTLLLVLLLLAWTAPHWVTGQGLRTDSDRAGANVMKAEALLAAWSRQVQQARTLTQVYKPQKKKSCTGQAAAGRLCGIDVASVENRTALHIATSPAVYDTRDVSHTGGWVLAPTPGDQGDCNSCVGWALAAAAQAAAAAAQRVNSNTMPRLSVRQLLFCNGARMAGDCSRGWYLETAVDTLTGSSQQRAACVQGIATDKCLNMPSDRLKVNAVAHDCKERQQCNEKLPRGSFSYTDKAPLEDIWQMQQHIRRHGASVVTRMALPKGFKEWFDSPQRRTAVYSVSKAEQAELTRGEGVNHAVVLAGYNNIEGYWIIWSSWGNWAEGGFARVRFGQLAIGEPRFTYGIVFQPASNTKPALPLAKDANLPCNCQWYMVQPGDYVSKVADALGLSAEQLLQQNVGRIPNLGAWLKPGQQLQACDVSVPSDAFGAVSVATAQAVSSETTCVTADTKEVRWALDSVISVPASETPSGKKWQYFYTYGFSQSEAENVCVQLGGHLVTVDSNRTNQMLYDRFVAQNPYARDGIWIGLTAQQRTTDRSKFYWLSGAKTTYQNWGTCNGKPLLDNWDYLQGQCAVISGSSTCGGGAIPRGSWDDDNCEYGKPFVCEFAPSVTRRTNQAQITVRVLKSATAPDGKLWAFFFFNVVQAAAQKYCEQSGGNLVTVDNANKTDFLIKEFLKPVGSIGFGVWIGLYMPSSGADPRDKSQYRWYSRARTDSYDNWGRDPDQPDGDALRQLGLGSCVNVIPSGDEWLDVGVWNDVSCDKDVNPRPFICEYPQS